MVGVYVVKVIPDIDIAFGDGEKRFLADYVLYRNCCGIIDGMTVVV